MLISKTGLLKTSPQIALAYVKEYLILAQIRIKLTTSVVNVELSQA